MRHFFLGVLATVVLGLAAVYTAGSLGLVPANADAKPSNLERSFAQMGVRFRTCRPAGQIH